jgi:hypothetical protein
VRQVGYLPEEIINGQSGTEVKKKKEYKEAINKQEKGAYRKRDRKENKGTDVYLLNSFFHLTTFVVQILDHDAHFLKSLTQEICGAQCVTHGATCFLSISLVLK